MCPDRTVLTDNHTEPLSEQMITAVLLNLVLLMTLALLFLAGNVHRLIGDTGVSVISRVMGIILATIAVDSVLGGLNDLGVLALAPLPS